MNPRIVAALALLFSGLTALVYEIVWTRLLGFVFGTTSESIGTVLAVFFAGMAIGNAVAARRVARMRNPLRVYALLELGIGVFSLLSLPLLTRLDLLYAWFGADHGSTTLLAMRFAASCLVLLPPTIAMGATLPVVARGVVGDDASLGRWSGILYACNTLGAVAGAYLAGFWLIPELGLTRTLLGAAGVNLAVAAAILVLAGRRAGSADTAGSATAAATTVRPEPEPHRDPDLQLRGPVPVPESDGARRAFLVFFGISGFVAIGYEVVWSKLFSIIMEGTLYGFATVLSAYLLGIGLGSLAISPVVDRIRDLPRVFALLHVGIAAAVAAGLALIPWLPYASQRLTVWAAGADATHLLFLVVSPVILLPAALFGAAFPVLIRIYTSSAGRAGEGIGVAVAVNTTGSIAASLLLGFWALETLGMDATLYALILLDLGVALLVLLGFQTSRGFSRLAATAGAALTLAFVSLSFNGVGLDRAIAARGIRFQSAADYQSGVETAIGRQIAVLEGRNAVVTVSDSGHSRGLRTNGLPEAGTLLAPPYRPFTASMLGAVPYLLAEGSERALVIGLGGGNTLYSLLQTDLEEIRVVELEPAVVTAVGLLHQGRSNPLDDPRVELRTNDGRNELLLGRYRGEPGFDVIASQPSHPWLLGAANLFTEEYFRLARGALAEGGVFAAWVNGFRSDPESILALATSFERVFPGSALMDVSDAHDRTALLLIGSRAPLALDTRRMAARLAEPPLAALLALHGIEVTEDLLARFEALGADLARIDPDAANTDDNAYVETRIPRRSNWATLDFDAIESRLVPGAPLLPPLVGPLDAGHVARRIAEAALAPGRNAPRAKLGRWLLAPSREIDPVVVGTLAAAMKLVEPGGIAVAAAVKRFEDLAAAHPDRAEPLRALGHHRGRMGDVAGALVAFASAHARSGDPEDAALAARYAADVDPVAAETWLARVPRAERPRFPDLAVVEARLALGSGATDAAFAARERGLERYRATPEGRRHRGLGAILAALAEERGDAAAVRRWRDHDARERDALARPQLDQARAFLAEKQLDAAARALGNAGTLVPGSLELLDLRVAHAAAAEDRPALEAALVERRRAAPDVEAAIGWENQFRRQAGLPLLPEASLLEIDGFEPTTTPPAS